MNPGGVVLRSSEGTVMTSLRTVLARHRSNRAQLRDLRALEHARAEAPTLESAHEIASLAAHR